MELEPADCETLDQLVRPYWAQRQKNREWSARDPRPQPEAHTIHEGQKRQSDELEAITLEDTSMEQARPCCLHVQRLHVL